MKISAESYGHAVLLKVNGELTEDLLTTLQQAVDSQLQNEDIIDVVLNVEKVPFIDGVVLEYLIDLQERLVEERIGQVKFTKPDENLRKILEITRLDSTFDVFDDISEAIRTLEV